MKSEKRRRSVIEPDRWKPNKSVLVQVVSWLAPPVDDTETEDKTDETSTDPSRVYLLNAADLEPLTVKVCVYP